MGLWQILLIGLSCALCFRPLSVQQDAIILHCFSNESLAACVSQNAWLLISCIIHNDNSCKGMSHNHLLVEINILILWKASALNRFKRQHICWQLTHFSGQLHYVYIYILESNPSHRFFLSERESVWKLVIYPQLIYLWGVDVRLLLWDYLLCLFKLHYPSVLFSIHIVQSH